MRFDVTDVALAGSRKLTQLDFVANNLANASTTGFKAEHLYYAMTGRQVSEGSPVELGPTSTRNDFSQGTLSTTGNTFDLAIEGDGFFTIQTQGGNTYTRNGSFMLNSQRELVTSSGDIVMGEDGRIVIESERGNIQVGADGTIQADENVVGKVRITAFENPHALVRAADGRFIDNGQAQPKEATKYRIAGGHLEMSNVNAIREMVDMIEIQRAFETYQKVILTLADMDQISVSRIGKLI